MDSPKTTTTSQTGGEKPNPIGRGLSTRARELQARHEQLKKDSAISILNTFSLHQRAQLYQLTWKQHRSTLTAADLSNDALIQSKALDIGFGELIIWLIHIEQLAHVLFGFPAPTSVPFFAGASPQHEHDDPIAVVANFVAMLQVFSDKLDFDFDFGPAAFELLLEMGDPMTTTNYLDIAQSIIHQANAGLVGISLDLLSPSEIVDFAIKLGVTRFVDVRGDVPMAYILFALALRFRRDSVNQRNLHELSEIVSLTSAREEQWKRDGCASLASEGIIPYRCTAEPSKYSTCDV